MQQNQTTNKGMIYMHFMNGLTEEYLKAFVISIEVQSPEKYIVHWFDDTRTEIRM